MSYIHLPEELTQPINQPHQHEVIHNPHYQEYLKLSQKQWMFSDLLPMDKEKTILCDNKQKLQVLNILKHLYESAAEALYAFYIDRRVDLFDAHVGESACQIRAVKLAVMLKEVNLKVSTAALDLQTQCLSKVKRIKNMIELYQKSHRNLEKGLCLKSFFNNYDLDVSLHKDSLFIIICYLLSVNKLQISIDKYIIQRKKLMQAFESGKAVTNRIITNLQKITSYLSVEYIFARFALSRHDIALLSYQLQKDNFGRWVLPTLITFEFLLSQINKYNIPVCLEVTIESNKKTYPKYLYLYKDNMFFDKYHATALKINHFQYPIILIQGFVKESNHTICSAVYKSCLNEYKLSPVILANVATHSQYTGSNLMVMSKDPYTRFQDYFDKGWLEQKLLHLKDLQASALMHGFCKFNPEMLAITHTACITQDLI